MDRVSAFTRQVFVTLEPVVALAVIANAIAHPTAGAVALALGCSAFSLLEMVVRGYLDLETLHSARLDDEVEYQRQDRADKLDSSYRQWLESQEQRLVKIEKDLQTVVTVANIRTSILK